MNILYIEDDRGLWTLVRHALKEISIDITDAHSLSEARELVKEKQFSLAIVDYELPDGNGLEFVCEFSSDIPCIMLTGVGCEELVVSSMLQGAKDYVVKDVQGRYLTRLPRIIKRIEREIALERENRQKELELANARHQLKTVFDAAPDLMIITDDEGCILQMSKSACNMYGLSTETYIGESLSNLIPEDCFKKVFADESGVLSNFATKLIHKYDVNASSQQLKDDIYLVVFRNQAERIKASKAIAQAEAIENKNKLLQKINQELISNINSQNNTKIIGNSLVIRELLSYVKNVADTDATVLILGETGTGKELIADEIHNQSNRRNKVIIKLNCASIPHELIESELFGYEKGAFTGAKVSHQGRFAQADGGTLFLDEIGELDLKLQSKLLRVLQEGEILPLGSKAPKTIDVRVVTATNRELDKMVQEGTFRADLYYRINVVPLYAPPLRERVEDIPLLATYFYQQFMAKYRTKQHVLTEFHVNQLSSRSWPGNVRELQNIVERFVVLGKLDASFETSNRVVSVGHGLKEKKADLSLDEVEKQHILLVLDSFQWIISGQKGAAAALGLNPSTLRFRMQKLGIHRKTHQPISE